VSCSRSESYGLEFSSVLGIDGEMGYEVVLEEVF